MLSIADPLTFTFSALLLSPKSMKSPSVHPLLFTFITHPWPAASYWSVFQTEKYVTATAVDLGFSWSQFLAVVMFEEIFGVISSNITPHFAPSTSEGCSLHCSTTKWPVICSLEETHDPVQLCNVLLTSFCTSVDLPVLVVFSFVTWVYLKSPCPSLEKDRYKPGPVDRPGSGQFPVCPPGCSTCVTGMCDSVMGSACSTLRSSAHATFTIWWRSLHWINSFCSLFLFVVNGSPIFKRRHDRLPKDVSQSVVTQRCREALRVRQGNTKVILQDTISLIDWS